MLTLFNQGIHQIKLLRNISIYYKIMLTPLIVILGYVAYLGYSTYVNNVNSAVLKEIENIDYPVIDLLSTNIANLDKVTELYSNAVAQNEAELLDNAKEINKSTLSNYEKIEKLSQSNKSSLLQIQKLKTQYIEYADIAVQTTQGFLNKQNVNFRPMQSTFKDYQVEHQIETSSFMNLSLLKSA